MKTVMNSSARLALLLELAESGPMWRLDLPNPDLVPGLCVSGMVTDTFGVVMLTPAGLEKLLLLRLFGHTKSVQEHREPRRAKGAVSVTKDQIAAQAKEQEPATVTRETLETTLARNSLDEDPEDPEDPKDLEDPEDPEDPKDLEDPEDLDAAAARVAERQGARSG